MTEDESTYNTPDFIFGAAAPANPGESLPAKVGFEAPDFEAQTLAGEVVRLRYF